MDNTIIPYEEVSETSSEELNDSSDDNEIHNYHILSNNIGVHYKNFNNQSDFMNMEKSKEYETIRNKYFTPETSTIRLLVDSRSILNHKSNYNTSNYTVYFDNNKEHNKNAGYGNLNNIIGFRLIKAMIHNSIYRINNNNNKLIFQKKDEEEVLIKLIPGNYTFEDIALHLLDIFVSNNLTGFDIIADINTLTYEILNDVPFSIKFKKSNNNAYRFWGFQNNDTEFKTSHKSHHTPQQNTYFVDLVIPEIPYIACKKNNNGRKIIDRIPLDGAQGQLVNYSSDINPINYFYPTNIDKLTIQLYEDGQEIDNNLFYDSQNNDNSFEFEIIILNK